MDVRGAFGQTDCDTREIDGGVSDGRQERDGEKVRSSADRGALLQDVTQRLIVADRE
jgi:hypothetical protein